MSNTIPFSEAKKLAVIHRNYNAKSLNVAQKVASKKPWHFSSQYEGFIWVNIISIINPDTFSLTSTPTFLCPKTKKGEDELLFIYSYVAEKPGGCLDELTCGNVKFHSLFNSYLSTLNQHLNYLNALI